MKGTTQNSIVLKRPAWQITSWATILITDNSLLELCCHEMCLDMMAGCMSTRPIMLQEATLISDLFCCCYCKGCSGEVFFLIYCFLSFRVFFSEWWILKLFTVTQMFAVSLFNPHLLSQSPSLSGTAPYTGLFIRFVKWISMFQTVTDFSCQSHLLLWGIYVALVVIFNDVTVVS